MRVLVFGVFDLLHKGHQDFLRQARALGSELVVSVARDSNVLKFKGHLPVMPEKDRLAAIKALGLADRAVLGELHDPWKQIVKLKPDVIALGYDQKPYLAKSVTGLEKELRQRGLWTNIKRLKGHSTGQQKTNYLRFVRGRVKRNLGRGTRLGFPTANISAPANIPDGLYVSYVTVPRLLKNQPALAFVGAAITFGETKKRLEAYVLDFNGDLGGRAICVEVLRKVRGNKKFANAAALVRQMKKDEQFARQYFKRYNK